jgi:short-subunit dehydrogenase
VATAPKAFVTGATSGLGAQFARQLAARGHDLVLVARDGDRLTDAARVLHTGYDVAVDTLSADLTTDAGCAAASERMADVDVLVNNAGIGSYRPFGTADLAREEYQLDLNVRAVMRLAHAAVRVMKPRGSGRIVNISSVAGFVPRGGNVTYSASKAWVTMFSEALSVQLRGSGVTVTAVCPGFVHTEFHERAETDMSHVPERMWLHDEDVVRDGLDAAFAGKPLSVPSWRYRTLVGVTRVVPRSVLRSVMARRGY